MSLGDRQAYPSVIFRAASKANLVFVSVFRLNLRELGPLASHMRWFVWFMAAAGSVYVFNFHER